MYKTAVLLLALAVAVYVIVVVSGLWLRGDPIAYLPSDFPGNQLLMDWSAALQQSQTTVSAPVSAGTPAAVRPGSAGGCPPSLTVQITTSGNRIPLTVRVVNGSRASRAVNAILDTGGVDSTFRNEDLTGVGFVSNGVTVGHGIGGSVFPESRYELAGGDLQVFDGGRWVALTDQKVIVFGIPAMSDVPVIGPTVADLNVDAGKRTATITPRCGQ